MKDSTIIVILLIAIGIILILDYSYQKNIEKCVNGGNTVTYCENELAK